MRRGEPGKSGANVARNISKNGPATAEHVNLTKGSDTIGSGSNGHISQFERKHNISMNPGKYQIDDHRPINVEAERTTGLVSNRRFVRGLKFDVNLGLKPGKGKNGKTGKGRNKREIVKTDNGQTAVRTSSGSVRHFERRHNTGVAPVNYQIDARRTHITKMEAKKTTGNVSNGPFVRGLNVGVDIGLNPRKGKNRESGKGRNRREIGRNRRVENGGNQNRVGTLKVGAHAACKDGNIRVADNGNVAGSRNPEPKPGNNKVENEQKPRKKEFENKQECGNNKTENEQKPGNKEVENEPKSENKQESGKNPGIKEVENREQPRNKEDEKDQKHCKDGKEPKDKVGKEHNGKGNETENKLRNCDVTVKGKHPTKVECGAGKASTVVQQNTNKNNTTGARHTRKVIRTVSEPRNPNKVFKPFSPVMI